LTLRGNKVFFIFNQFQCICQPVTGWLTDCFICRKCEVENFLFIFFTLTWWHDILYQMWKLCG